MTHADRAQVAVIASHIGSTLMEDNRDWVNRFTIDSTSSSRTYVVAQRRSDEVWGCSCPSWRHRRRCKHLIDILARLAEVAATVEDDPVAVIGTRSAVRRMLASARTAYLELGSASAGPTRRRPPMMGRAVDL